MNELPKKGAKSFPYLSDFLPASLVKDIRQSIKNPLYLALIGLVLLFFLLGGPDGHSGCLLCTVLLLCFLVPMRVSMNISQDLKERGSNFLMLSPMSPWRIVWGQFLSCMVQCVVLGGFLVPICYMGLLAESKDLATTASAMCDVTDLDIIRQQTLLGKSALYASYEYLAIVFAFVFSFAAASTALMMVCSIVPLFCRLGIAAMVVGLCMGTILSMDNELEVVQQCLFYLPSILFLVPMLLLLASRHYASPSELRSGTLRFFTLVYLLSCAVTYYQNPQQAFAFNALILSYVGSLCLFAIDELMPIDVKANRRRKQCYLARTCTSANMLMMLVATVVAVGGFYFTILQTPDVKNILDVPQVDSIELILSLIVATIGLGFMYSFCVPLFLCNICVSPSSRMRPVVFACCVAATVVVLGPMCVLDGPYAPYTSVFEAVGNVLQMSDCLLDQTVSDYRMEKFGKMIKETIPYVERLAIFSFVMVCFTILVQPRVGTRRGA